MVGATTFSRSMAFEDPSVGSDGERVVTSRHGEVDWYDLVMAMLHRTRWRGPSLAAQILTLLVGGLVVAQAVTLVLTLLLPPEPPARFGLADIAASLRSAEAGRSGLRRDIVADAPNVDGRGWLTSDSSRGELAKLLGTTPDNVQLSFYTPLPFAGTVALPPPAANASDQVPAAAPESDLKPATLLVWKDDSRALATDPNDRLGSGHAQRAGRAVRRDAGRATGSAGRRLSRGAASPAAFRAGSLARREA